MVTTNLEKGKAVDTRSVRIDAYLQPVPPPWPESVVIFESLLAEGFFDDLHTVDFEKLLTQVDRGKKLVEASFNVTLNRVLKSYGLYVTNVARGGDEQALAYGSGYDMSSCLEQAREMRDWFLPAVISLYRYEGDGLVFLSEWLPSVPCLP